MKRDWSSGLWLEDGGRGLLWCMLCPTSAVGTWDLSCSSASQIHWRRTCLKIYCHPVSSNWNTNSWPLLPSWTFTLSPHGYVLWGSFKMKKSEEKNPSVYPEKSPSQNTSFQLLWNSINIPLPLCIPTQFLPQHLCLTKGLCGIATEIPFT